ncbi:ABC transporter permease [Terrisporobacter glycolicus]|uniref:ABC transport system permease protein n=1 Tax=Terrisporobacter glycolicus ATCC 14880 = DSM 1288 TaxID=1121315 RepID=A0ABZ2EVN5_9FIRM|nr:ABC transporter permease [Terrisporobacter glycolicus]
MNLYTALTLRYLKENKKRTIVTIVGIILSTALICGIGNIFESLMDYQTRKTIELYGSFHATFDDIKKEDINLIVKSSGISKYGYSNKLGYSKINDKKDNLIDVEVFDKTMFESYNIILKEGKFPTKENEIVFSETFLDLSNKKVGDTINLEIGKRVTADGEDLSEPWISENEKIINTKSKDFKIVGIINKPKSEYGQEIINGITYLDINKMHSKSSLNVSICTNNPEEIYKVAPAISKNLGLKIEDTEEKGGSYNYNNKSGLYYEKLTFNENLLRLQGASAYENKNDSMNKIIILITSLVVICTISTVYNAFSISISERKKQFGILNSIGATKSQTMKLVFLEAFIVSVIGIPIGLLSGTFAIDIVFKVIQNLFGSSSIADMNLRVVYSPYVIIISTIVVLTTIFISATLPAITASKISPIDAIKNSSNLKIGKIKDSKIVRALFKTEGVLAYKNLRRNKKKFRITLFSLIVSVVIFISFSGFMNLFMKANRVQMGEMNYDLYLDKSQNKNDGDILGKLKNVNGIKKISMGNYYEIIVDLSEKNINEKNKDLVTNYYKNSEHKNEDNNEMIYRVEHATIKLPGDMEIRDINLKEGSFNKEDAIKEKGVILINKSYYQDTGKEGEIEMTNYKVGDTVKVSVRSYNEEGIEEKGKDVTLKILGITDDLPTGSSTYSYLGLDFITYDEVGKELGFELLKNSMYIVSDKEEDTRKVVKEISDKYGYNMDDKTGQVKEMEDTLKVMQLFVYGFITVISLVSVTNIVNTISTNINLRKRELSIIKSIGITSGGFNKMVYLESLLYGLLSLIYGVPMGLGLVVLMNVLLGDVIKFGLVLPWSSVLICGIGIFIITFISSYIPMKNINKENIIENIRQESI